MKRLLIGSLMAIAMIAFSGCTYKAAQPSPTVVCNGCENLPDCVPGPYGDCLP